MSFIDFSDYDANSATVIVRRARRARALGIAAGGAVVMAARARSVSAEGNALVAGTAAVARPSRHVRALALAAGSGAVLTARPPRVVHTELVASQSGTVSLSRPPRLLRATGYADDEPGAPGQPNAGVVFLARPPRAVYAEDTVEPPTPGYASMVRPVRKVTAQSVTLYETQVSMRRAPRVTVVGYTEGAPGAPDQPNAGVVLMARPARSIYATVWAPGDRTGALMPNYPVFIGTLAAGEERMALNETLSLGDAPDATWINVLQDRLRVQATPTTLLEALASAGETLTFREMVSIAYAMLVSESVEIGGSLTANLRHALQLADSLTLVSGVGSALNAQVTVATAFALADSLASVYPSALSDTVDLSGTVGATLAATLKLLDAMRLQDAPTPGVTWLVQTDEAFTLTDANATTATLAMLLADGIEMLGELRLEDGAYLAWVVNTETRAFVKYRNFPFNSFAKIGNRYFGASGDGIYELTGDDDAGEPINAVLRGGLDDLGSSLLKRHPAAYIGYRGDNQMVLKVRVMQAQPNGDLQPEEHWYRMEPRQANALRVNRVKLGKGLKSTYWGWELVNIDGADFEVDSFSWYPVVLERRLN